MGFLQQLCEPPVDLLAAVIGVYAENDKGKDHDQVFEQWDHIGF